MFNELFQVIHATFNSQNNASNALLSTFYKVTMSMSFRALETVDVNDGNLKVTSQPILLAWSDGLQQFGIIPH